jgi:acyl-CoA thioesterase
VEGFVMTAETPDMPAETLATLVGDAMWSRDRAPQMLGMRLLSITPGAASLEMVVREEMTNGHAICHGGLIFTLADTAFAYACNSGNQNTVASACHVDFLAPAMIGDTLIAEAIERSARGRTGVYDVTVSRSNGDVIALFRGKSARIKGTVLPTADDEA